MAEHNNNDDLTPMKPISKGASVGVKVGGVTVEPPSNPNPEYFSDTSGMVAKQPPKQPEGQGDWGSPTFDFSASDEFAFDNAPTPEKNKQTNTENGITENGSMVHDADEQAIQAQQEKLTKLKKKNRKMYFIIGFVVLLAGSMVMNKFFPLKPKQQTEQVQVQDGENSQITGNESGNPDSDTAAIKNDIQAALGGSDNSGGNNSATDENATGGAFLGVPAGASDTAASNASTPDLNSPTNTQDTSAAMAASEIVENKAIVSSDENKQAEQNAAPTTAPQSISLKDEKGQPKWDFFFAETGLSDKEKQAEALKARLEEITGKKFALFPNDEAATETATQAANDTKNDMVDMGIDDTETAPIPIHGSKVVENAAKERKPKPKNRPNAYANKPKKQHKQVAKKSGSNDKEIRQPEKIAKTTNLGYSAKAIVFGKMWLNTPYGTQTFVNGDTLPNGAVILDINPNSKIVKTNQGQFKID